MCCVSGRVSSRGSLISLVDATNSGSLAFVKSDSVTMLCARMAMRRATALQHHVAHGIFTFAAACADAQLELQFIESSSAIGDQGANFFIRN